MTTATETRSASVPDTELAHEQLIEAGQHIFSALNRIVVDARWSTRLSITSVLSARDALDAALRSLGEETGYSRSAVTLMPPADTDRMRTDPAPPMNEPELEVG